MTLVIKRGGDLNCESNANRNRLGRDNNNVIKSLICLYDFLKLFCNELLKK